MQTHGRTPGVPLTSVPFPREVKDVVGSWCPKPELWISFNAPISVGFADNFQKQFCFGSAQAEITTSRPN